MLELIVKWLVGGVSFALILTLLVFVHEWGHYIVARLCGVSVQRFSIGFGKPIFKYKAKSGTEWVFARIPLGGYVKFLGDAGAASNPDVEELERIKKNFDGKYGENAWKSCLHFKPLWQRALVAAAGPIANFVLAALLFAILAFSFGTNSLVGVKVAKVVEGSAAAQAGFQVGDEILSIDGKPVKKAQDVMRIVSLHSGDELKIHIRREGRELDLKATPRRTVVRDGIGGKAEMGRLGIAIGGDYVHTEYSLAGAGLYGISQVKTVLSGTMHYIGRIFVGKENGKAMGGIVRIAAQTGKIGADAVSVDGGFKTKLRSWIVGFLWMSATLSVGLGFANLMPIPVLDGGHLLYYGYEAIMRRPLSMAAQEIGFRIGLAVLLTLLIVLTVNDTGYVSGLFSKNG